MTSAQEATLCGNDSERLSPMGSDCESGWRSPCWALSWRRTVSDASPVHTQGGSHRTPGRRAEAEPGWKWSRDGIEGEETYSGKRHRAQESKAGGAGLPSHTGRRRNSGGPVCLR